MIRAVAFLVRDRDWGTLTPTIRDLRIAGDDETRITYAAQYQAGGAHLDVSVVITLSDTALRFQAEARATGDFETNRTGFTVLHPISGVAGAPCALNMAAARPRTPAFPR
ncbi:hypothetical protein ACFSHQ_25355 [Gemmobacter lanyuensis]